MTEGGRIGKNPRNLRDVIYGCSLRRAICCLSGATTDPIGVSKDCFAYTHDAATDDTPLKRTFCSQPSNFICQMGNFISISNTSFGHFKQLLFVISNTSNLQTNCKRLSISYSKKVTFQCRKFAFKLQCWHLKWLKLLVKWRVRVDAIKGKCWDLEYHHSVLKTSRSVILNFLIKYWHFKAKIVAFSIQNMSFQH